MELKIKKEMLLDELRDKDILEDFEIKEHEDFIVFRTENASDYRINMVLNEGISNSIYYNICKLNYEEKRDKIINLLNDFNEENKVVKFYLDDDYIVGEVAYINEKLFEPELFMFVMVDILEFIEKEYHPKIMKALWS